MADKSTDLNSQTSNVLAAHPVATAVLMAIIYSTGMGVGWILTGTDYDDPTVTQTWWMAAVVAGLAIIALVIARVAGISIMGRGRITAWAVPGIVLYLVPLLGFLLVLSGGEGIDWRGVLAVLVLTICVGIGEELAYRGVVLNGLGARLPLVAAVYLTAVLFGLLHSVNVLAGLSVFQAVFQVVFTSIAGSVLAWIYLFSGRNLLLVITLHFGYDFAVIGVDQTSSAFSFGSVTGPLLIVLAVVYAVVGTLKFRSIRVGDVGKPVDTPVRP